MNDSRQVHKLVMRKDDLETMEMVSEPDNGSLEAGEALLRVHRFSLTTNNITYAAYGEPMQYWDFFPVADSAWGQMPVWGFAEVEATTTDDLAVGERIYGYLPIADTLRVRPSRVTAGGFVDDMPHRRELPSGYNQYVRCAQDPLYTPETEALQAIYRPLFVTSYTLADYLRDNDFFGVNRIVLSSARSETAYGTAFALTGDDIEVVGLTSATNADFVRETGFYDQIVDYSEVTALPTDKATLYVDFAGNRDLRSTIHHHFGDELRFSSVVGSAKTTELPRKMELPGPRPTFFFAPEQIRKSQQEWGREVFGKRFGAAWSSFLERAANSDVPVIRVVEGHRFDAAERVTRSLLRGKVPPQEGHIVTLD